MAKRPAFEETAVLSGHEKAVVSVKFKPGDGSLVASASADASAKIWSPQRSECVSTLRGHAQGICDVAWNSAGTYLCTASDDHTLKLWDAETGKAVKTLTGHTSYVFCCSFHPQGHLLASGSFDETMRVWDVRTGKCLREVPAHSDPVTAVDFNHDGTLLLSSSLDGLLRIWDTQSGHCLKTIFDKESPPVSSARFCPNGRYVLSGSLDSTIRLWDFENGKAVKRYSGAHTNKQFCAFSDLYTAGGDGGPGPCVLTGSEDGSIYVYGLNSKAVVQHIPARVTADAPGPGHCDAVLGLSVHPTEQVFASSGHEKDRSVRIWGCKRDGQ
ncbi:hypothetical protein FOA52_005760 [Chlamydomonas sp. UWO 241]|nr:hypothetical protein FOA52_005760 [Chlamydomonas sp. UWO 241]